MFVKPVYLKFGQVNSHQVKPPKPATPEVHHAPSPEGKKWKLYSGWFILPKQK